MTRNYYQDKIDYLEQIAEIDKEIEELIKEMDMWKDRATRITTNLSNEPIKTDINDKVGDSVAKIADIDKEIDKKIDELVDLKEEIKSKINMIDDVRYRNVLRDRYVYLMTWDAVAKNNDYVRRHIYRLKKEAIERFEL